MLLRIYMFTYFFKLFFNVKTYEICLRSKWIKFLKKIENVIR